MYTMRTATTSDHRGITALVAQYQMVAPVFGATSSWWVVCDDTGRICATIGAEYGTDAWLLRSAIVADYARGHGLGGALTRTLLRTARAAGIATVYCFSTDAGDFWQHMGFTEVAVAELLAVLPHTPQVAQFEVLGWLPTEVAWRCDVGR